MSHSNCLHYMPDDAHAGGYCDLLNEECCPEGVGCDHFYDGNEDGFFDDDLMDEEDVKL